MILWGFLSEFHMKSCWNSIWRNDSLEFHIYFLFSLAWISCEIPTRCHMKFMSNSNKISYEIPTRFHMKFQQDCIWNSTKFAYEIQKFHTRFNVKSIWNSNKISCEIHMKFQPDFIWNFVWIISHILWKLHWYFI